MRQKLGLCCALIHDPDLLILDEPTTGVDPLSRRQFWQLVDLMRSRRTGMSVVVATAYMEEAEQFDWLVAMNAGQVLAAASPADLMHAHGTTTLEEAFIALLPEVLRRGHKVLHVPPRHAGDGAPVIVARDLTCRFGDFTAVDRVSFSIGHGEIYGFLGSNGCGKTTTMKMLTGLLPATSGEALLFGRPINAADMAIRSRVGYMSQSFSLYTELTVRQNLQLHARLFHLPRDKARARIAELVAQFGLQPYLDQRTLDLPLGIRQRLSLAVAIVHSPEILILDEPTSGVDPLERDRFWELLIDLSRAQGVTIFVSTHFMNEAARCDRISLMDAGRVLATDTPAGLVKARGAKTLEDAFIGYLEEARGKQAAPVVAAAPAATGRRAAEHRTWFSAQRMFAYSIREALELLRDPIRLGFGLFGTALLMLVFGFGVTTDVNNLTFAVLDRDQSSESRAYLEELRGSSYFVEKAPIADAAALDLRIKNGDIQAGIEIPPGFGRDIKRGRPAWVSATVDGAMPFVAQTIRGYLQAMHALYLVDPAVSTTLPAVLPPADIEIRFKYNQNMDSIYAMVPADMSLFLALFPAILMALAIVREKELGSITNLYVTPVTRLEFLIGKQLPYIAIATVNFALLFLMTVFIFAVPLKGSFSVLLLGVLIYVATTTAYGMLISAFTSTQIAALFGTAILTVLPATQFSGMMTPVSSLAGAARYMGLAFPMTYFVPISVGTFTKGLGWQDLGPDMAMLALFIPALLTLSMLLLRKQER
jgi:ribosome-dependent ATPase